MSEPLPFWDSLLPANLNASGIQKAVGLEVRRLSPLPSLHSRSTARQAKVSCSSSSPTASEELLGLITSPAGFWPKYTAEIPSSSWFFWLVKPVGRLQPIGWLGISSFVLRRQLSLLQPVRVLKPVPMLKTVSFAVAFLIGDAGLVNSASMTPGSTDLQLLSP